MPELSTEQKQARLNAVQEAVLATLTRLDVLARSGNPDVAADAESLRIDARNVRGDINILRALVATRPARELKPISAADLAQLDALESAIDARRRNNQILTAGLTITAEVVAAARSVHQILDQANVAPLATAAGAGAAPSANGGNVADGE